MIDEMDVDSIVEYFRGKSILITGSTGFLGKVLVEKILRVQPDVKKLFLLIRASDVESAKLRIQNEVIEREIFQVLKEKHGVGFNNFVKEKIFPLVGDIMDEDFGLDTAKLREVSKDIDIIVNGAATTKFYERYDVAFYVNVLGAKHVCAFARKCTKLKMLLHVSTAYVVGEQEGLIAEKPFFMGETLRAGTHLDIGSELNLIKETRRELRDGGSTEKDEMKVMKKLGLKRAKNFGWPNTYVFTKAMGEMMMGLLRGDFPVVIIRPSIITSTLKEPLPGWMEGIRTVDTVIMGYANQTLSSFLGNLDSILDMIPGDMVVNAMMAALLAHSNDQQGQIIYNVTSSLSNPATSSLVIDSMHRYFFENPPCKGNGERIRLKNMRIFSTLTQLRLYMAIKYKLPLEMLRLVSITLCGIFSECYNKLSRKYRFVMRLMELYAPYSLFKGCFEDTNLEKLRMTMRKDDQINNGAYYFDFDPRSINWVDYFYGVHIPGVLKYCI
ncbi:fatty acyl-CoA reductase 1-like [Hordeum vulgare subsp. vulgare]|uniref:Fatty acyl-CoA reductase n=1 Tax=Hordeum vulgare subsp. vulgare TaxID=112509 RepID=A0A8I6X332_HORVV|nr:fatty acyl-CoA reductase 1-like [Hordeum vulgare subsp. vulgare]